MSDDGDALLVVDAADGGYILASFDTPPPEDWVPTVYADQPGEVATHGKVATVNALGSPDERVLLSCISLEGPPSPREAQDRIDQGAHVVRFTFDAAGPIVVMANDLEHQGVIAPNSTSSIELECCIYMLVQAGDDDSDDPVEEHHMRIWPADGVPRRRPWWRS